MPQPAVSESPSRAAGRAGERAEPLRLFTTLARTGLFVEALQRECLSGHGLSFAEYSVLRLLQRAPRGRLTPTALADAIVCTTGAMTKLVDRLTRAGYAERQPDPADRRGVLVQVTREGRRIATAASRSYKAGRERILAQLDEREMQRAHEDLLRLLEVLEADRASR
ncbi:MAG: MarR family transcriptional regulator [Proteobacteria bacterium]|nr:MarR family transcriptional regulator [Pseudomonadota bacterium]